MTAANDAPRNGAGAEYVDPEWREYEDPRDSSCCYCGKTTAQLHQIKVGSSLSWQCQPCFERTQQRYAEMTGAA